MSNLRVVIMAHRGSEHRIAAHAPYWKSHKARMWLVAPADSQPALPAGLEVERKLLGLASHNGPESVMRVRDMILMMAGTPSVKAWLFYEYDALCLDKSGSVHRKALEDMAESRDAILIGNLFDNGDPNFPEKQFVHPPVAMNYAAALELSIAADESFDPMKGNGFWDRWLGYMAEKAGIRLVSWGKQGFSRNTIEKGDFALAVEAAKAGACMFHGVKSSAVLGAISETYAAHNPVQS